MKILPISPNITTKKANSKYDRFFRQQYLERFEQKNTPEFQFPQSINKVYNTLQKALLFIGAYSIGLFGYNLRTQNYNALDERGIISYIHPEQTDFKTRREVFDYATKKITTALNCEQPYEHAIYINNANNEVLAEFKGDKDQVYTAISFIDKLKLKFYGKGATLIHGHPSYGNGITPPISPPDFETLCGNDFLTEIVAMDKDGKVSLLRKTPFFTPPTEESKHYIGNEIVTILFDSFEDTLPEKFSEIISAYQETTDSLKSLELKKELDYYVLGQDSTEYTNYAVHQFWHTNAKSFGLEYFTNFPNNN